MTLMLQAGMVYTSPARKGPIWFLIGQSYSTSSIALLKNLARLNTRWLYMDAGRRGMLLRLRKRVISLDASSACLNAAVTPFDVIGSTMAAASPATSQLGPAVRAKTRQRNDVVRGGFFAGS